MKKFGARILSEANDLKRTPEALAREIGWEPLEILSIIEGKGSEGRLLELVKDMVATYPLSFTDLWLEPDDTDEGVTVMRSGESHASLRVLDRKDSNGKFFPYYEYRDTAMSRTAPYKPEWIQVLRFVDDEDPNNPDVAFNNGHLLHQLTFFIGEVNFYWISGGKKSCRTLNTGDSCYITPFIPHSFTSRNRDRPGLIIAVTFSSSVRRALGSLSQLTPEMMDAAAGDLRDPTSAFAAKLKRYRDSESLSISELSVLLQSKGVEPMRASLVATANTLPTDIELRALAKALGAKEKDLEVRAMNPNEDIAIRYRSATPRRLYPNSNKPACNLIPLARTKFQPGLRGFNIEFLGCDVAEAGFEHCLHEYAYNYGDQAIRLSWGFDKQISLNPGDSAYIRPGVKHCYSGPSGATTAIVRIPGELTDSVFEELSTYDSNGRSRANREYKRWF